MTNADLQISLAQWIKTLPDWQSDLLRRLTIIDDVSLNELEDATKMLLASLGVAHPAASGAAQAIPISASIDPKVHRVTQVVAMQNLVGVGAIESRQRLDFKLDGLTIVYGETGSGKSSYVRVLRKACRSSAKPIVILPNVLSSQDEGSPSTAQIEVVIDGATKVIDRQVNDAPDVDLHEVSVFDSDCADAYTGGGSEVTYTPSSLHLLQRLVEFQDQIRTRLNSEIAGLTVRRFPASLFDPSTEAGAVIGLLDTLDDSTDLGRLRALASINEDEIQTLAKKQAEYESAKSFDPARVAQLEAQADGLDYLATELDQLSAKVNEDVIAQLRARSADTLMTKVERPDTVAKRGILQIGTGAWSELWRAARSYMLSLAADVTFPAAEAEIHPHCPLCQQSIGDETLRQLRADERYVTPSSTVTPDALLYEGVRRLLVEIDIVHQHLKILLVEGLDLRVTVQALLEALRARAYGVLSGKIKEVGHLPLLMSAPIDALRLRAQELRVDASRQRESGASEDISSVILEIAELEGRLQLQQHIVAIEARILDLEKIIGLRRAYTALATNTLSRKLKELTDSVVTDQLRTQLDSELAALGSDRIPVVIGARGSKGKTKLSLKLNTEQKAGVVDVLSEGERRSVALAFFLAEVAVSKHRGGIVIDDPVSSLDHSRRSYVARRLVAESAVRQTIVFTHDIVFLLELEDQIEKRSAHCERRVIFKFAGSSGLLAKVAPWIVQNVKARIGSLKNDLQRLQALERAGDPEVFRLATKAWFELLRETWERVVEEKVFNGVVARFSPAIQTQRLAKVLVTAEMAKSVEEAMTQASAWTHDQGAALAKPTATSADLKQALDDLETFCGQFKN